MTSCRTGSLRDSWAYPVVYMFAATFVATGVLIGFSRLTAERVAANRQVLFERAVLLALGWDAREKMSPADIHASFLANVAAPTETTAGAYTRIRDDGVAAYALPFEGQGFWHTIRGVIGISADALELTGMAFYEQSETPGLGAEIVKPYFTDRFKALALGPGAGALRLKPVGTSAGNNEVDAIAGATQTCARLEDMLNRTLEHWRQAMRAHTPGTGTPSPGQTAGEAP